MSGPDAQAARVDRARLRDQLRAAERRLARPSQHLVAAFDAYRASHGTQTDAVIKNLKKLRHTAAQEVKTLKRLEVSTAAGRHAKSLALRALVLLEAGAAENIIVFSHQGTTTGAHAAQRATRHVRHALRLERSTGRLLHFHWQA